MFARATRECTWTNTLHFAPQHHPLFYGWQHLEEPHTKKVCGKMNSRLSRLLLLLLRPPKHRRHPNDILPDFFFFPVEDHRFLLSLRRCWFFLHPSIWSVVSGSVLCACGGCSCSPFCGDGGVTLFNFFFFTRVTVITFNVSNHTTMLHILKNQARCVCEVLGGGETVCSLGVRFFFFVVSSVNSGLRMTCH